MEEILHQLIGSLPHYLQGFIHPKWRRISAINSRYERFARSLAQPPETSKQHPGRMHHWPPPLRQIPPQALQWHLARSRCWSSTATTTPWGFFKHTQNDGKKWKKIIASGKRSHSDCWNIPIFDREHIFNPGSFSSQPC